MRNSLIITAERYELLRGTQAGPPISDRMMSFLDFVIIEEKDGSVSFLKNRHNGWTCMSADEYAELKEIFK